MRSIPLTKGFFAIVDEEDFDDVSKHRWCVSESGRKRILRYAVAWIMKDGKKRMTYLHRFLLPEATEIDHKDGNGLNNIRSNLRSCTHQQNAFNANIGVRNKTGFIGVYWHPPLLKWTSRIRINGKKKHLGYFDKPELAAKEYDRMARLTRGQFAVTNFR